jgi:hypothetical protein
MALYPLQTNVETQISVDTQISVGTLVKEAAVTEMTHMRGPRLLPVALLLTAP